MKFAAVSVALGLVAAACGGDDDGATTTQPAGPSDTTAAPDEPSDTTDAPDATDAPGTTDAPDPGDGPRSGGSITVSETFILSADPTIAATFGCCGGTLTAAIFDTVIAFNWETREYEMRTAESLEPNDDLSVWTLRLRPGITFTDGSAYDAEAVAVNFERHRNQPRSQDYFQIQTYLDTVEVVDDLTVEFTLTKGWSEFPSLLAGGAGMIANPAAIEAGGENFGLEGGDLGAGPFKLESITAHERAVLVRNDDYYGGEVYLDQVTVVAVPAAQSVPDSIRGGTLHGGGTVFWTQVAEAEELGYPAVEMIYPSGLVILMNSGTYRCAGGVPASVCDGVEDGEIVDMDTATSDPRVRLAVMHAIDRDLWNDRFYQGTAPMSDRVFSETLSWSPDVASPAYDPEEASRLVEEAKADGWDGTIRLVGADDPAENAGQLTFAAMLEAVGMNPVLDLRPASEYRAVIQTDRDFDVYAGAWGFGNSEDKFFTAITRNLQNYAYGYDSAEMNAAIDEARVALSIDDRRDTWAAMAEIIAEENPVGFIGTAPRHFIHSPALKGLQTTGNTIVLFDKAWLDE